MYIAIEGIDTAGKSTQIAALQKAMPDAIITKEPGGTLIGKEIRELVLSARTQSKRAEMLLFLADRAEHTVEIVKPNLHKDIISDRSAVSGIAYALTQGDIEPQELLYLNDFATQKIYPQKVFLLQLTKEELLHRLSQKELDGIELRGSAYLLAIQEAMKDAAKLLGIELVILDATQSKEAITQQILNNIKEEKSK